MSAVTCPECAAVRTDDDYDHQRGSCWDCSDEAAEDAVDTHTLYGVIDHDGKLATVYLDESDALDHAEDESEPGATWTVVVLHATEGEHITRERARGSHGI